MAVVDFQGADTRGIGDRGPDKVKDSIQSKVQAFLDEDEGPSSPLDLMTAAAPAPKPH